MREKQERKEANRTWRMASYEPPPTNPGELEAPESNAPEPPNDRRRRRSLLRW